MTNEPNNSPAMENPVIPGDVTMPEIEQISELQNSGAQAPLNIPSANPNSTGTDLFAEPSRQLEAGELVPPRKRGRPRKTPVSEVAPEIPANIPGTPEQESSPGITDAVPAPPVTAPSVDYQYLARLTVIMGTNSMAMVFGPDWNPEDENETVQLTNAIAAYMQAKDVRDIPPGALLAIVLVTYSAKRLKKPAAKEKLRSLWTWAKSKLHRKPKIISLT